MSSTVSTTQYQGVADESVPATPFGAGQIVGAVIAIAVLSLILKFALKRFLDGTNLVLASVASAVAIATFLYAFGSADGGPPRFGAGFAQYGIGGVIVLLLLLWLEKRKNTSNG